jgi:hypothetical protein
MSGRKRLAMDPCVQRQLARGIPLDLPVEVENYLWDYQLYAEECCRGTWDRKTRSTQDEDDDVSD